MTCLLPGAFVLQSSSDVLAQRILLLFAFFLSLLQAPSSMSDDPCFTAFRTADRARPDRGHKGVSETAALHVSHGKLTYSKVKGGVSTAYDHDIVLEINRSKASPDAAWVI
jgi:hypothetical protein